MADRRVRRVTFIPPIKSIEDGYAFRKKVAAYARVSTGSDEQETSLEAQMDYYENHIKSNKNWIFVDVYYDDGISGLSYRNRDGFNRMIDDALDGKIDLILTKSLSRFARNTVDTLVIIRKLKEKGIEVYFEKEDIHTLDSKGEFLITLMSSLAQEESRSISENVAWGRRKQFADGKYSMAYASFLGFDKGPNGTPIINEEQAKIVRLIYWLFLVGFTEHTINKILTQLELPAAQESTVRWHTSVVYSILQNEKYKGDALLQKSFTVDFLTKKTKLNEGELPQYYLEKVHPSIVSDEVFAMVQVELRRRQSLKLTYSSTRPLSSKIICDSCGSYYGRKQMHRSYDQIRYYAEFWRCNRYYDNHCDTAKIRDEIVHKYFRLALAELMRIYDNLGERCAEIVNAVLKKDLSQQIEDTVQRILATEKPICSYAIFQRRIVKEIRIVEKERIIITFVDENSFSYKLTELPGGRII